MTGDVGLAQLAPTPTCEGAYEAEPLYLVRLACLLLEELRQLA